jgi:hypothetical protein
MVKFQGSFGLVSLKKYLINCLIASAISTLNTLQPGADS